MVRLGLRLAQGQRPGWAAVAVVVAGQCPLQIRIPLGTCRRRCSPSTMEYPAVAAAVQQQQLVVDLEQQV